MIRNFDAALEYLKADGCSRVRPTLPERTVEAPGTVSEPGGGPWISDVLAMHAVLQVHVMAHSMGGRVLAGVSQRIADIFAPSPLATEPRRSAVPPRYSREEFDLGSVIMLSPDMDLGEFAGHTGPLLRSVCDNVVIYGDEHDSALNYAAIGNGYLFKLYPDMAMPNLAEHWCAVLCRPALSHAALGMLRTRSRPECYFLLISSGKTCDTLRVYIRDLTLALRC